MWNPKDTEPSFKMPAKPQEQPKGPSAPIWRPTAPGIESNGQQLRTVDDKPKGSMMASDGARLTAEDHRARIDQLYFNLFGKSP